MKLLKLILPTFLLSLFFSFSVHAQSLPEISRATFTVIQGGEDVVLTNPFYEYGLLPYALHDAVQAIDFAYNSITGRNVSVSADQFTIRPLSDIEKENLNSGFYSHFYDASGNEISINDLYYAYANTGFCEYELYIDSNGNVLYEDPNQENTLLNIGYQSRLRDLPVYSQVAQRALQGDYNYYPENIPTGKNTYFYWLGETVGNPLRAGYILIPNQWIPGKIEPINHGGQIYEWYTNDLSLIENRTTLGSNYNIMTVTQGNYSAHGYTYKYYVKGVRGGTGLGQPQNYNDWITGANRSSRVFACIGYLYSDLVNPENSVPFKKVVVPEMPVLSDNELYSYDDLQSLKNTQTTPEINPNYDPNSTMTPDNYPFSYPAPEDVPIPSVLPLPGSNPNLDPNPGLSPEDILNPGNDPVLPSSIPFLDNLQTRFPFSIPWDIKRMLQALQASPVAPSFDISWYIAPINYTWEFSIDLSEFSTIASIFRTLFLISFIIGLAIFSYNHFFGS